METLKLTICEKQFDSSASQNIKGSLINSGQHQHGPRENC